MTTTKSSAPKARKSSRLQQKFMLRLPPLTKVTVEGLTDHTQRSVNSEYEYAIMAYLYEKKSHEWARDALRTDFKRNYGESTYESLMETLGVPPYQPDNNKARFVVRMDDKTHEDLKSKAHEAQCTMHKYFYDAVCWWLELALEVRAMRKFANNV
ncbi:hypothetical protein ACYPKM_00380 [Pseudomonas aeruginosa]